LELFGDAITRPRSQPATWNLELDLTANPLDTLPKTVKLQNHLLDDLIIGAPQRVDKRTALTFAIWNHGICTAFHAQSMQLQTLLWANRITIDPFIVSTVSSKNNTPVPIATHNCAGQ